MGLILRASPASRPALDLGPTVAQALIGFAEPKQAGAGHWGCPRPDGSIRLLSRGLAAGERRLEIASAALIALPASRIFGAALGALIIAAAILTVLRHRDYQHLLPLSVFVSLIALAAISS